jgi:hypothetical protein
MSAINSTLDSNHQSRNRGHESIVVIDREKKHLYLGLRDASTVAFLEPHRYGLELRVRTPGEVATYKRFVIPGEVSKSRAVDFITNIVPGNYARNARNYKSVPQPWKNDPTHRFGSVSVNELSHRIDIAKALDESGIWKRRGMMDPQKKIPPAFFKKYNVHALASGRHSSIQAWWKDYLTKQKGLFENLTLKEYVHPTPLTTTIEQERVILNQESIERYANPDLEAIKRRGITPGQELARKRRFGEVVTKRRNISALIELGLIPESPTSVRRFDTISPRRLAEYINHDIHRSKVYGRFMAGVEKPFRTFMSQHNWLSARGPEAPAFEKMVYQLEKLPKSKRAMEALGKAVNAGLTRDGFNDIADVSIGKLEQLTTLLHQIKTLDPRYGKRTLNSNYVPPDIPLEDGWKFADHTTFETLSDKYNCCISNQPGYEELMIEGRAHTLYREDHKTNGGAVAFIEHTQAYMRQPGADSAAITKQFWKVSEIRGHSNKTVDAQFEREAEIAAKLLTKLQPDRSPRVGNLSTSERNEAIEAVLIEIAKISPRLAIDRGRRDTEPNDVTQYTLNQEAHELDEQRAKNKELAAAARRGSGRR